MLTRLNPVFSQRIRRSVATVIGVTTLVVLFGCSSSSDDAPDEATGGAEADVAAEPVDPAEFPDVLATVNGAEIAKTSLESRVSRMLASGAAPTDLQSLEFYKEQVGELIDFELLFQASQDRGLAPPESAVDERLAQMRGQLPQPEMFEQSLSQQGMTVDEFKQQVHRQMSIQAFIDATVDPEAVEVSATEIQSYYDENPDEMKQPDRLRLSHILKLVEPTASDEDKQAARASLEEILEQVKAGGDFGALAQEHSDDRGSASNGGELVVSAGQTVPPFEKAAFALEEGEVTDIVETRFGFHIIKLSEKMAGESVPFEQVSAQIENFLKQKGVEQQVDTALEQLRESAEIESFL